MVDKKIKKPKSHKRIKRKFILIWLIYLSFLLYLAVKVCGHFCFDTLIYRKDNFLATLYGYKEEDGNLCKAQLNSEGFRDEEFYPKKKGEYLILVIGDRVVYGQGLLKHKRFSEILEKELDKVRPTRVMNLGVCGINIYQYYQTTTKFTKIYNPDLVIIGFTENDLLVWRSLSNFPTELSSEGVVLGIRDGEDDLYVEKVLASYDEDTPNIEMLKFVAPLFPKNSLIVFSFAYLGRDKDYNDKLEKVLDIFRENNLTVIDTKELYQKEYKEIAIRQNGQEFMAISKKEKHPNSLANRMFTERLFQVITSDPKYGFIK